MPVERFGDSGARRWIHPALEKRSLPIGIAAVVFAVAAIAIGTWQTFQAGADVRVVGVSLGLAIGALVVLSAIALWSRYWSPVRRAVREVSRTSPASVVLGGRIPRLAPELVASTWPEVLGPIPAPQHIVLSADGIGITLLSAARSPQIIGRCAWPTILDIRPVEYVEDGRAYDGLAITGPTPSSAGIVQVVNPGRAWVSFPRGAALQKVADRLLGAQRD